MEDKINKTPTSIIIDMEDYSANADIKSGYVNYFTFEYGLKPSPCEMAILEKFKQFRNKRKKV
jgi:hypothetical protein